MKQPTTYTKVKAFAALAIATGLHLSAAAQEKVEVNGKDVGTWFSNNWMWVSGVVLLLLLVIIFGGSSRRRKTTTVVRDNTGDVKKVTTTETEE